MLVPTLEITHDTFGLTETPSVTGTIIWKATEGEQLDRPIGMGWKMADTPRNREIMEAWKRAIDSGAATCNHTLDLDVSSNTFVNNDWVDTIYPMSKYLEEHVIGLGFLT